MRWVLALREDVHAAGAWIDALTVARTAVRRNHELLVAKPFAQTLHCSEPVRTLSIKLHSCAIPRQMTPRYARDKPGELDVRALPRGKPSAVRHVQAVLPFPLR